MSRVFAILTLAGVCVLAQSGSAAAKEKPPAPCKVKGSKWYPGEDVPKAELAKWMAKNALKAGLAPELPVMGALVESNLTNLRNGDADSVGFFQMRTSIWDQGQYAGFADDPQLQIKWFIDQALLVRRATFDELTYGDWVADVIRPPEEFRGRYQLRLEEARSLICA
jgi:hypothetical protein